MASPSTLPSCLFLRMKCVPGCVHGAVLVSPVAPPAEKSLVSLSDGPIRISVLSVLAPTLLGFQCTVAAMPLQLFIVAGSMESAGLD